MVATEEGTVRDCQWDQEKDGARVEQEQCPSALKKGFRCSRCAQPLRLRLQRGRGDPWRPQDQVDTPGGKVCHRNGPAEAALPLSQEPGGQVAFVSKL